MTASTVTRISISATRTMAASKRRMQRRRRPDLRKHGPQLAANLLQQLRRHPGRGKPLLSTRILRPANQLTLPAASNTPGLPRCTIRFRQSTGYFQRIGPAVNPAVQRPERRGFSCRPLIAAAPSRSHLAREPGEHWQEKRLQDATVTPKRAARANFG